MDCITNRFRSWCMLHRFSWLNNILNNMQYATTFALKHEIIKKGPQIISKVKAFINKYKWKEKNIPSRS